MFKESTELSYTAKCRTGPGCQDNQKGLHDAFPRRVWCVGQPGRIHPGRNEEAVFRPSRLGDHAM